MSTIHYFQRYSSVENTVTNNTLQFLSRIYGYSTRRASEFLNEITEEDIEIGISIKQQERAKDSVPDGEITQRSFKILIESKVDSPVDEDQLLRHAASFTDEYKQILLLLTRQEINEDQEKSISEKIRAKYPVVVFKNITYEKICIAISGFFADYESDMKTLAEDYIAYCNDTNLYDQSRNLMRIVPCGKSLDINKKYRIYFHPSDRGYTKHRFVGLYAKKTVQCLWEIDSVFDVSFDGKAVEKTLVQGRDTNEYDTGLAGIISDARRVCGYKIEQGHRFFCGKEVFYTDYRKTSSGGIQGPRFVNLMQELGEFKDAQDIAERLRSKEWR